MSRGQAVMAIEPVLFCEQVEQFYRSTEAFEVDFLVRPEIKLEDPEG